MKLTKASGIGLIMLSFLLNFIGILMLGNVTLLVVGNASFVAGVLIVMGPDNLYRFCFQKKKIPFIVIHFAGIVLILKGHPFLGVLCELLAICVLFATMIPSVLKFLFSIPVIGPLIKFALRPQIRLYRLITSIFKKKKKKI
ncbi:golgi transport protein [Anaeramoeba flamelloides]|uniref:Golgi transport protein n=1 Tax=Anaeramoeba flamelloides TaxID=1746091 RepID=A0AAV7ZIP3_9EUKA|nr:golgi transport protein 1-related [Anaeramoeba flamelloides]KAJ6232457.1 golgi transport protein [Anaeramoeba flamelloides]